MFIEGGFCVTNGIARDTRMPSQPRTTALNRLKYNTFHKYSQEEPLFFSCRRRSGNHVDKSLQGML